MELMKANTPSIIWTENGCWFQQWENGLRRSSYLGHIGTPEEVKEFCESKAIDFTKHFHAFNGAAISERWPKDVPAETANTPSAGSVSATARRVIPAGL